MNLKKIIPVLLVALTIGLITPAFASNENPVNTEKSRDEARAQQLMSRLTEIRNMDKSNLTSTEKRELRKEVREMKKEVKKNNSRGIYLSVGAIIIIVLLLILLL
jgi:Flp pilus assembly protein TadB